MAAQRDVVEFDWVANREELEEVLCVLAGSDPENCSYSRVSRGPTDSLSIAGLQLKGDKIDELQTTAVVLFDVLFVYML